MSFVLQRPAAPSRALPVLTLVVLLCAAGWALRDSLVAMWSVWRSSESFAHGPLIPLGVLWLVWRRRAELAAIPIQPWWPAAIAVAAASFGWLLGRLAGVNTVEQLAIVGLVPGLVALVLGWRIAWSIAFPLLFLVFAVPFGTQMLPTLMDWTADFTVFAVKLTGIPVYRDGTNFTLPSGSWSVVESCSGIRYLLAAVPLAFLYSYLSYRSYWARVQFIVLTVIVALVANWVRAYIIVMLGHVSNMRVAVGADHLVYGWVFFGIVMAITFWLGNYIRDKAPAAEHGSAVPVQADTSTVDAVRVSGSPAAILAAALLGLAIVLASPFSSQALRADGVPDFEITRLSPLLDPLPTPANPDRVYRPHYHGALDTVSGSSLADPSVGVTVLRYAQQDRTAEMIHSGNRVMPGKPDESAWRIRSRRSASASALGTDFPQGSLNEYVVVGPDGRHLVWEWFQVQDQALGSPSRVKLATALAMLQGRGDESLAWFVWTPLDGPEEDVRRRLAAETRRLGAVPLANGR